MLKDPATGKHSSMRFDRGGGAARVSRWVGGIGRSMRLVRRVASLPSGGASAAWTTTRTPPSARTVAHEREGVFVGVCADDTAIDFACLRRQMSGAL